MKRFLARLMVLATVVLSSSALGQTYPVKPVRLIVPFSPGGSTDLLARALAQRLGDALGQQVIVDNRPGANTILAYDITLNAPADGYTLLMEGFNGLVLNPNLYTKLPYDAERDFVAVGLVASSGFLVVVNPNLPFDPCKSWLTTCAANPAR